jgi:hypothetical protein
VTTLNLSADGANELTTVPVTVSDNAWTVICESGFDTDLSAPTGDAQTVFRVVGSFGTVSIFDSGAAISPAGPYAMTTHRTLVAGTADISHIIAGFDHA